MEMAISISLGLFFLVHFVESPKDQCGGLPLFVYFSPEIGQENGVQYYFCNFTETDMFSFQSISWDNNGPLVFQQVEKHGFASGKFSERVNEGIDSGLNRTELLDENPVHGLHWMRINSSNFCDEGIYRCRYVCMHRQEISLEKMLKFSDPKPNCNIHVNGVKLKTNSNCGTLLPNFNKSEAIHLVASVEHTRDQPTFDLELTENGGGIVPVHITGTFPVPDNLTCTHGLKVFGQAIIEETKHTIKIGEYCQARFYFHNDISEVCEISINGLKITSSEKCDMASKIDASEDIIIFTRIRNFDNMTEELDITLRNAQGITVKVETKFDTNWDNVTCTDELLIYGQAKVKTDTHYNINIGPCKGRFSFNDEADPGPYPHEKENCADPESQNVLEVIPEKENTSLDTMIIIILTISCFNLVIALICMITLLVLRKNIANEPKKYIIKREQVPLFNRSNLTN